MRFKCRDVWSSILQECRCSDRRFSHICDSTLSGSPSSVRISVGCASFFVLRKDGGTVTHLRTCLEDISVSWLLVVILFGLGGLDDVARLNGECTAVALSQSFYTCNSSRLIVPVLESMPSCRKCGAVHSHLGESSVKGCCITSCALHVPHNNI